VGQECKIVMTRKEIANKLHSNLDGLTHVEAGLIVDEVIAIMRDALIEDEKIYLRGFGTFYNDLRKERKARVITRGETIIVPERKKTKFKPCKSLINKVNEN